MIQCWSCRAPYSERLPACPQCGASPQDDAAMPAMRAPVQPMCARSGCRYPAAGENPNEPGEMLCHGCLEVEASRRRRWIAAGCPSAEHSLEMMRSTEREPRASAAEHWQRVLEGSYPESSKCLARAALADMRFRAHIHEREPGEDDE